MNYDETLAIMSVLKAAYPAYYRDMKRSEAEGIVGLWTAMFAEEPAELVAAAVKAHIASDTKGFPPHIGAIKNAILRIQQPEEMSDAEAWSLVSKAIKNGIWGAKEEFAALPHLVQKIVGSPQQLSDWARMDSDSVHSVVASNFQRAFRAKQKADKEYAALPNDVKTMIAGAAERMALEQGGKDNDTKSLPGR